MGTNRNERKYEKKKKKEGQRWNRKGKECDKVRGERKSKGER